MRIILITIICLTFLASENRTQSNLWSDISESQFEKVGEQYIIPDTYRTVNLNLSEVDIILNAAPMEFTLEAFEGRNIIELPMPDGSYQLFKFWESPTMEYDLQIQYPEIRTYTGQGIDDPYATLKFDFTPAGFHAQILSPNGRVFIDPHNKGDIRHYISYYTKDFHKINAEYECQLFSDENLNGVINRFGEELLTPSGPQLRTYRLAVATTGEYTAFHGGSVASGLAAVVTSINRVNGVYEKEVAVRMVLIANNNLIIYTNASTDPYSNNNGSAMLTQNINNLSLVIGNSNFDIGHVFSTGGGGVAYLGSVCTSNKAGGVTGSSSPVGDPFDIDYVAHEIGHQFGGNHSFNGTTGSCSGGNRNASTAYEPGSGSTIMAYAGICPPQDLQPHSDAYFHVVNFDEIIAFTNSGTGNNCAVVTSTGNNAPLITVPAGGFSIPKSTPFSLTGSAVDPNGDAVTYCWEEYDLGPAGAPGTPSGDAPIFRSWNPSISPTRIFPRLTDLLNNTTVIGELLPTYSRNLKFRLTVRDNRAGGGGVDRVQVNFTVDGNSGPFVVSSPNSNVSWNGNTTQTITWSVANTNLSPVNCSNVRILLSTDGGNSFLTQLVGSTPNDGSEVLTIPNLPTTQARIKIEAVGNIFFDISNTNFTIINNPIAVDPVSFSATAISSSRINVTFTPNISNNNVVIAWNNTGTFTVPSGPPPAVGQPFAGGTLLYNGTSSPQLHTNLISEASYFYKAFSYNGTTYSPGLSSNATTFSIQDPSTFTASPLTSSEITVGFTPNVVSDNVVIVWNNTGTFTVPSGPPPAVGQPFAGGALLFNGLISPVIHSGLTPSTDYYYRAFSYDGTNYSFGFDADATTLTVPSTFQLSVSVTDGWNMVSVPGLHPVNQEVATWWSGKDPASGVFRYSNGYLSVTAVSPSNGYWMKHIGANIYNTGDEWPASGIILIPHNPINVDGGWNLIGGYENNVSTSDITSNPPGIINSPFYGYNSGYYVADTLKPGYGYWVNTGSGQIVLPSPTFKGISKTAELINKNWGKIIIADNIGKSYTLYSVSGKDYSNNYELPPVPPSEIFDIRYGSGKYAEDLSAGNQSIVMQGLAFPIKVRVENMTVRLKDEIGIDLNGRFKSGDEIVITNSLMNKLIVSIDRTPTEYSLEQNYPNPFNPSTLINFSISKQTQLKLNLYNVLGELVLTIAEGVYEPGFYEVKLDANSLVSGVYLYQLECSETVISKKLILLR